MGNDPCAPRRLPKGLLSVHRLHGLDEQLHSGIEHVLVPRHDVVAPGVLALDGEERNVLGIADLLQVGGEQRNAAAGADGD